MAKFPSVVRSISGTGATNNGNTSSLSTTTYTVVYCMVMGVLCCCFNIMFISYSVTVFELSGKAEIPSHSDSNIALRHQPLQQSLVQRTYTGTEKNISLHALIEDRYVQTLSPEWDKVMNNNENDGNDPIRQLLMEALGSNGDKIDDETLKRLPTVEDVTALYGSTPVVLGLETCDVFQHQNSILDAAEHLVSVAGSFNTGTNLLAELLIANCYLPARYEKYRTSGVRWQVLWGKHTPVDDEDFRKSHRTYKNETGPNDEPAITAEMIFPGVTIRDPFKWMQSMCRHEYGANWLHDPSHCPNLVPNEIDEQLFEANHEAVTSTMEVSVKYKEFTRQHISLVEFWNDWNRAYVQAPFPRLMVRFEDIIFHPKQVTQTVCECAGGQIHADKPFTYVVESAKKGSAHGTEKTSYVDALVKYGTENGRYKGFTNDDLQYAQQHLDPVLMRLFGYRYPSSSLIVAGA